MQFAWSSLTDGFKSGKREAKGSFGMKPKQEQSQLPATLPTKCRSGHSGINQTGGFGKMKFLVLFEQGRTSVGASVPDLPGCIAVAATLDGTRTLIAEAIEFHIEGMILHGEDVPEPANLCAELVEISLQTWQT